MLLSALDQRFFLRFDLLPLDQGPHRGWHGYRIQLGRCDDDSLLETLESTPETTLFLEARDDPEVPAICDGVEEVMRSGGTFRFTPCDERDFVLEVSALDSDLVHRITATDKP